jgi:hypothetical protein
MPRKPIDYSKSMIYMLCCKDATIQDKYVGSTTDDNKRKHFHKVACTDANSKAHNCYVYQFIRENGGFDNWEMVLVEKYPCASKLELLQRERYWTEKLGATLNTQVQGYYYALGHNGYHAIKNKEYYENNKEKVTNWKKQSHNCECGGRYRNVGKSSHCKSKRHQKYLSQQNKPN